MNGRERGRQLRDLIFAEYAKKQEVRRPNRVRPGDIGKPCTRALWYAFHWCDSTEVFEGRMLRLFQTGHLQEDRLIADLRSVGAQVISRNPENAAEQIGITALTGHMKGFLDGVAAEVPFAVAEWVLTEFKTHSEKSFKAMFADGVEVAKPEHYAQCQIYMHEQDLDEALYFAVNKNNDDLYCEFVERNRTYHARLMVKADMVAFSPSPPAKINAKADFFLCKFCKAKEVCHEAKLPERNCRNCRECMPLKTQVLPVGQIPAPVWRCNLHEKELSLDEQRAGCRDHRFAAGIVAGNETNTVEDSHGFGVEYQMDGTGEIWTDYGPSEPQSAPVFADRVTAAE